MAKSDQNLNAVFQDTANAIRAKKQSTNKITPRDFADEVASIQTGITPTGRLDINDEGLYNVTNYAEASVYLSLYQLGQYGDDNADFTKNKKIIDSSDVYYNNWDNEVTVNIHLNGETLSYPFDQSEVFSLFSDNNLNIVHEDSDNTLEVVLPVYLNQDESMTSHFGLLFQFVPWAEDDEKIASFKDSLYSQFQNGIVFRDICGKVINTLNWNDEENVEVIISNQFS